MPILALIGIVGASPQTGEILPLYDFFVSYPVLSCPSFLSHATRPGRTVEEIFMLYVSNDMFPRKKVSFGS